MPSVNKVILVGHLGADPELRQTASGRALCKFRIATSRRWTDDSGRREERTAWHRITTWGKQAELCQRYLRKGRQVYIEGRIEQNHYKGSDGVERIGTEIVSHSVLFLGPKGEDAYGGGYDRTSSHAKNGNGNGNGGYAHGADHGAGPSQFRDAPLAEPPPLPDPGPVEIAEDDLPF